MLCVLCLRVPVDKCNKSAHNNDKISSPLFLQMTGHMEKQRISLDRSRPWPPEDTVFQVRTAPIHSSIRLHFATICPICKSVTQPNYHIRIIIKNISDWQRNRRRLPSFERSQKASEGRPAAPAGSERFHLS